MLFRAASILLLISCLGFFLGAKPVNYALACLLAAWTAVSLWGMASMRSQVFGKVLWRGDPATRSVALSFDDGPWEPFTGQVLDVLREHGVKATFFVIGRNVARYPGLAARAVREGHELGNHTYSHPWMFRMLFSSIKADIERCQDEVEKAAGVRPRFFRQPVGMNNPSVMKVIGGMGLEMVGWQTRALDGIKADKEYIVKRILGGARPGGILMMHDGCDGTLSCDRSSTIEALREIIPALKERGYEFKTVGELVGVEEGPAAVKGRRA